MKKKKEKRKLLKNHRELLGNCWCVRGGSGTIWGTFYPCPTFLEEHRRSVSPVFIQEGILQKIFRECHIIFLHGGCSSQQFLARIACFTRRSFTFCLKGGGGEQGGRSPFSLLSEPISPSFLLFLSQYLPPP